VEVMQRLLGHARRWEPAACYPSYRTQLWFATRLSVLPKPSRQIAAGCTARVRVRRTMVVYTEGGVRHCR
jgi:hypothetical protein